LRTTTQQARFAGLLYFLLALSAPWGLMYVPGKLIVSGNATATADNLRASEGLMRLGIASELVHQLIAVFLLLELYKLFKPVDVGLSRQLVVLGSLLSVPIMFVNVLNDVAALYLVSGSETLSAFTRPQLDSLAYLFVYLHGKGVIVASVFWGLWLFPFALLVFRSRFIPRIFGYLLMVAGGAYLLDSFVTLVVPRYAELTGQIAMPLAIAEVPIIFWLLIWGAKSPPAEAA
jgi:hypothetical protein